MAIDRAKFFDGIRNGPFPGSLSQEAVRGITAILDEWERRGLTDLRWLAYMLATVLAECGRNMLPVREGFARSDAAARSYVASKHYKYAKVEGGQVYYGRGLVQLTWLDNYRKMSAITGLDLVNKPDLALEPAVAAKIMFEGMIRGTFTGKKLADYFGAGTDWRQARRIINGLDRADEIAGYGKQFYADLMASDTAAKPAAKPVAQPSTKAPTGGEATAGGAVVVGGGAVVVAASEGWGWMEWSIAGLALLAVCAAVFFGWRWWRARKAPVLDETLAVMDRIRNSQPEGTPTWTGDQLPASSPPSLPNSELSSEQLSAARLALSSAALLVAPSPQPSARKRPRKQSAKPSRKTRKRPTSSRASKNSAARKSSPKRKPKSRGRNSKG